MNTTTTIKRGSEVTAEEIYKILKLRNAVFIVELNRAIQDVDGEDLKPNVYQLLTTTSDGKAVGHLRLHVKENTVQFRRVVVATEFRGKSLGREIMAKAIEWCRENKYTKLTMGARAHLVQFYSSFGFKPVGDLYFHEEVAVWHQDMEMDL